MTMRSTVFRGWGTSAEGGRTPARRKREKRLCQAQSLPVALKPRTGGQVFVLGFRDPLGVCRLELQTKHRAPTQAP